MDKTVEARVSISTDTRVEGRYFVDVRDTTNGRDRQMTTRVTDTPAGLSVSKVANSPCCSFVNSRPSFANDSSTVRTRYVG